MDHPTPTSLAPLSLVTRCAHAIEYEPFRRVPPGPSSLAPGSRIPPSLRPTDPTRHGIRPLNVMRRFMGVRPPGRAALRGPLRGALRHCAELPAAGRKWGDPAAAPGICMYACGRGSVRVGSRRPWPWRVGPAASAQGGGGARHHHPRLWRCAYQRRAGDRAQGSCTAAAGTQRGETALARM